MSAYTVVMFGEAEKGRYRTAYLLQSLSQLAEYLGNPPPNSKGLFYAVQTLLFQRNLIFIRVKEEGFSYHEYLSGLHMLEEQEYIDHIHAICLPGVGDATIIEAVTPLCRQHHSILITTEPDLYDYLTESKRLSA